jgi:Secretion system C-terminal sorting domain
MKKLFLVVLVLVGSFRDAQAQCPQNAFAFISPYAQCPLGCGVLLKDWPEGVIVNIYGGSPITIITTALIQGTFGGPGTGDAFVCVPCNIPLIFASIVPGATNGCVIIPLGTVPIKLTDFSVASSGSKSCLIKWNTSDEPGSTRYTLQRSTDSRNFSDITTFTGKGKPVNNYSYEDRSLPLQNLFYRIKTTEVTGKINFSEVILLKNQLSFSVSIYPNPSESDFNVTIPNQFLPAAINIYNSEGKGVHSLTTMQPNVTINKKLPKGVYAVRITGKHNESVTDRLLIR